MKKNNIEFEDIYLQKGNGYLTLEDFNIISLTHTLHRKKDYILFKSNSDSRPNLEFEHSELSKEVREKLFANIVKQFNFPPILLKENPSVTIHIVKDKKSGKNIIREFIAHPKTMNIKEV